MADEHAGEIAVASAPVRFRFLGTTENDAQGQFRLGIYTHFFDTPRFYLIAVYVRPLTRVNRSVTRRTEVLSPERRKGQ